MNNNAEGNHNNTDLTRLADEHHLLRNKIPSPTLQISRPIPHSATLLHKLNLPSVLPTAYDLYYQQERENSDQVNSIDSKTENTSSSSNPYYHLFYKHRLQFLCPLMNEAIGGGIPTIGITEITGTAGSGKTQMILDLIVQAHLPLEQGGLGIGRINGENINSESFAPGENFLNSANEIYKDTCNGEIRTNSIGKKILNGGRIFLLSTEGKFPSKRMFELSCRLRKYRLDPQQVLHNVILKEIYNYEQQVDVLMNQLPQLIKSSRNNSENEIKMVVVDSISGLYRGEFNNGRDDLYKRSKMLFTMGRWMQKLSIENKIPFILTNQVTSNFNQTSNGFLSKSTNTYSGNSGNDDRNQSNCALPALGLSWSHCIHTRILLTRREVPEFHPREVSKHVDNQSSDEASTNYKNTENIDQQHHQSNFFKREMKLSLSSTVSMVGNKTCEYRILKDRIEGVSI